jgi:mannose-6-phosphate isomerase-like protein (cupin superfamily)
MTDVHAADLSGAVLAVPGAGLVLAQWTARPQSGPEPMFEAPPHRHDGEDEAWYVLSGVLRVRVGDDEVQVPAGGAVVVPRGVVHTYWNPGTEPARYLLIMGERTHALIQAIHAASDRSPEAMRQLFRSHGAELLG